MRQSAKKAAAVLSAALVVLSAAFWAPGGEVSPAAVSAADSLRDIQKRQKEVQQKLKDANKQLKDLEKDMDNEAAYQRQLTSQISLYQQDINLMNEQIGVLTENIAQKEEEIAQKEVEITDKEAEIEQKQQEIDHSYEIFKVRMRSLYMAGETSSLEMLFSAESFADFLTNMELMKAVSQSDEQLVKRLRSQKGEQEQQRSELIEIKQQQEDILAQIEQDKEDIILNREEIKAAQSALQVSYEKSKTAQQNYEAMQEQYEKNRADALAEEKAVEKELQDWYAAHASSSGSANSQFGWPLPGYTYISSGYGSRWGGFHTGIDITGGGVYGANIVAAESGTVIQATSHYSYGNYIIIDHGGGYSTLYAHASSLLVSVGQKVSKGQTIAKVGSTGNSTGPHLHFEVRVKGVHKNPSNYVKP